MKAGELVVRARYLVVPVAMALTALVGYGLRGVPVPEVGDEFGYLLSADTYTRHRLVNTTPECWVHLEAGNTLLTPAYGSQYFPGPGLMMAASQALTGVAWWGVVASCVAMAWACVWMLEGWTSRRWALVGGLLSVSIVGLSYWMLSYWGGALAAAGGLLVCGAYGRLRRRYRVGAALVLGLGAGVLALSRPLEGAALVTAVGMALMINAVRARTWGRFAVRVVLPAMVMVAPALAFLAVSNKAVTGDWKELPASLNGKLYHYGSAWLFMKDGAKPGYRHRSLEWTYETMARWRPAVGELVQDRMQAVLFYFPVPQRVLAVMGLGLLWRRRRWWALWAPSLLVAVVVLSLRWSFAHYFSVLSGPLVLVSVAGWQQCWIWQRRYGWARPVLLGLMAAALGWPVVRAGYLLMTPEGIDRLGVEKARMTAALPGPSIVLVTYRPGHVIHQEWVYNGAELGEQKVLWTRAVTPFVDRALCHCFAGRKVYTLEADASWWELREVPGFCEMNKPLPKRPLR